METADPGQSLAGKTDIARGAVRFAAALLGDALPGWAKWTLCALVAAGTLWQGGRWLLRRRRVGIR
ncbi:hypothetical protein SLAV_30035 [Streptomyces lavendulae subsp. lavendulae]|uniref:Uncharacterized protein n=1 Tax=Streptomyces lavendulae subsp. lavendulae TaxID=58340 RepID=A0A2K8PM51_STRLA|nr:hypothetical protein [Streptomyces lavendulae]ATZ27784.1 hypothetical protein SLAV_30035 [Streptomyces lavendulae subsp. lavendulae]QUQ57611.1 hypothetical protein SLLC_28185 [Streptomyces lavendulae subsp. lavendulae]